MTGAAGYVGQRLARALIREGAGEVCVSDVREPEAIEGVARVFLGDIRDAGLVRQWMAESRADCVVHVASFGMSGREMVTPDLTWSINVGGTENVCSACRESGAAMVYISTVNVCFDGSEIVDGDEAMGYAEGHVDAYSASKTAAERLVRETYSDVRSVSLRPYGIYGEGEERHFPRMIRYFKRGLFFLFGTAADASDWVHVDNLVHAILLADGRLATSRETDGEAFLIGDGEPVNTLLMCEPLWALVSGGPAQGLRRLWMPYWLLYAFGWATERVYAVLHSTLGISFEPMLSRAEVNKVGRTHFWQTRRVRELLGYQPIVSREEGLRRMYAHFRRSLKQEGYPRRYIQQLHRLSLAVILLAHLAFLLIFFC